MARMYYVNPLNTADIRSEDLDGNPIAANRTVRLPIGGSPVDSPSTTRSFHIAGNKVSVPEWDVYEANEDSTPTPQYYQRDADTLVFVGTVGDIAARVQETRNFSQIPIADLYAIKLQEIGDQDATVRYNAGDSSASVNWWIVLTERARFELASITANLSTRTQGIIDGTLSNWFPGGPNAPFVGIYRSDTDQLRRFQVDEATWLQLVTDWGTHDQLTGNATDASRSALDVTYADGAGVWQDVADHDPADPLWGYPPTVQLSPGALAQIG